MAHERVLIVEDQVGLEGRPLEAMLKKEGYKVIGIAETAKDAVKFAMRNRPKVVLMDIELVGAEGKQDRFAGLRAARKIRAIKGTQLIFVTGILAEPDVLSEVQKSPGYEFLIKPVRKAQLLASVQSAIKKAKRKDLVFVSYSHQDRRFAEEMMKQVGALKRLGVRSWIDTQIAPSQRWEKEINRALAKAKAAICLVSPHFIASDFITKVELPKLLKAEAKHGLRVYPVFINFVHDAILKDRGLQDFQGINRPDDPIAKWREPKRHQYCWGVLCKYLSAL